MIQDVLSNPIFNKFIVPILVAVFLWILKSVYDKYFSIKPMLFLRMGNPLYQQRLLGYDIGHDLTWRYECILKNNSKVDAYKIELLEISSGDEIISNKEAIRLTFQQKDGLEGNKTLNFEIEKTIRVDADVLIRSKIEDKKKVIFPGSKVQNPELALMPDCLKKIRLIVKYENEKGKKFYIKFTRIDNKESNKISSIRPFWFKKSNNVLLGRC